MRSVHFSNETLYDFIGLAEINGEEYAYRAFAHGRNWYWCIADNMGVRNFSKKYKVADKQTAKDAIIRHVAERKSER